MPTKYLIDVENIANKWMHYITYLQKGDTLIMFYSNAVKKSNLSIPAKKLNEIQQKSATIEYIQCVLTHAQHNVLDFQLAAELGARLFTNQTDKYVILSRDTGFDTVTAYWQNRGFNVTRSDPSYLVAKIAPNTVKTKQCRSYYESICVAASVNSKYLNTIVDIIVEGMLRPESDCLRYIHQALDTRIHPKTLAHETYRKLKDDLHRIKLYGPFPDTEDLTEIAT